MSKVLLGVRLTSEADNDTSFMGNGRTRQEYDPNADLAFYLKK